MNHRASALLATTALALVAAACGGSSPSSTGVATLPSQTAGSAGQESPAATPDASDQIAQALAYGQCMRTNGVPNWPDPDSTGAFDKSKLTAQQLGASDARVQAAQTACRHLLPNSGGPTQAQLQQSTAQALTFAQCMRSHGVSDFPDPDDTGRIPDPASVGLDQGAPAFRAANQDCGDDRPGYFPSNAEYDSWVATHGSGRSAVGGSAATQSANPTTQP